jgi:hypothetical protein
MDAISTSSLVVKLDKLPDVFPLAGVTAVFHGKISDRLHTNELVAAVAMVTHQVKQRMDDGLNVGDLNLVVLKVWAPDARPRFHLTDEHRLMVTKRWERADALAAESLAREYGPQPSSRSRRR